MVVSSPPENVAWLIAYLARALVMRSAIFEGLRRLSPLAAPLTLPSPPGGEGRVRGAASGDNLRSPSKMADLITSARAKYAINQATFSGGEDTTISALVTAVSKIVKRYCRREFDSQSYDEL